MEQVTELSQKAPPDEIKKVVQEFTRQTNISSDYSSGAGQYVRNQSERLGINPKLIRALRGMERQDDAKRQAWIREQIYGWLAMGYFDQVDAFDDLHVYLKEILARLAGDTAEEDEGEASGDVAEAAEEPAEAPKSRRRNRKAAGKADPVLDSLTEGGTTH